MNFFKGGTELTAGFDIILRAMEGCHALSSVEEITGINDAGFKKVKSESIITGESLYGVIAIN